MNATGYPEVSGLRTARSRLQGTRHKVHAAGIRLGLKTTLSIPQTSKITHRSSSITYLLLRRNGARCQSGAGRALVQQEYRCAALKRGVVVIPTAGRRPKWRDLPMPHLDNSFHKPLESNPGVDKNPVSGLGWLVHLTPRFARG